MQAETYTRLGTGAQRVINVNLENGVKSAVKVTHFLELVTVTVTFPKKENIFVTSYK